MTEISLCAVSDVDFEAFTAAFNHAYSDYFVPIRMQPSAFQALMQRDDLLPAASVAAVDGTQIVGTGLLGVRGDAGWIGGMGVIPDHRQQGIGRKMMHYLIQQARARALTRLQLEVIEANEPAIALYRSLGFEPLRYLHILEREPQAAPTDEAPANGFAIEPHSAVKLLDHYPAFHVVPNCWQRSLPSLRGLQNHVQGWAAYHDQTLEGYAVGQASTFSVRLLDIATQPGAERAAAALLAHLHQTRAEAQCTIINLGEDDPTYAIFGEMGYTTTFRQIEMHLGLD